MKLSFYNFIEEIKKINFIEKKAYIAVGVSGGVDSLSLIFLLSKYAKLKNFKIIALIVDHQIRHNSSLESKKVSRYLNNLKIKNKILTKKRNITKTKIQENARKFRLNLIEDYCYKNKIIHLFFAHHLEDNIETYILRKAAGSDLVGLNSIKPISIYKNIVILRPLLNFSKKSIIEFAKKSNINWFEDPSNYKTSFSRVQVRLLIKKNNYIKNRTIKELKEIKKINKHYNEMIDYNFALAVTFIDNKKIIIDKKIFVNFPYEIAYRVLIKSVIHLKKFDKKFRYHKLTAIYKDLLLKIGVFQSQKTKFESTASKILIF